MFRFRYDDTSSRSLPARRSRFVEREHYWYYITREGLSIGPFDSRPEAEEGCADFIDFITGSGTRYLSTLRDYGHRVA